MPGKAKSIFCALAFCLSGCGEAPVADGRTELTLWKNLAGLDEEAATKAAIDRFNASQTKWHVRAQSLPQGAYSQSVVSASLSGRMPCIMTVDNPQVARFVWAGHLQRLQGHVPEALLKTVSPAAIGRFEGRVYSVGQFDAALAIFTRRTTLAKIGARVPTLDQPWSLKEFDGVLEKLKATGAYRYPLDFSNSDPKADWWTYGYSPILQSFGGDLIKPASMSTAEGVLNGASGQRFGNWFQSLFSRGLVNRMEPDQSAFIKGRAALVYTGNWWTPAYREHAKDDLLILPPPDFGNGVVIGGGSWQWAISKACPHPDGAGAFISFLMQPREVARMSDAIGLVPVTAEGAALSKEYRPGGRNRIFFDMLQRFARQRPSTPAFTEISNAFYKGTRNIMDGKDVQDSLDDAADEIDNALADNDSGLTRPHQRARP
ncbi:extracellular solute-binding protein [Sphingopyxis sp. R3-92]|uniref:extracellular solute-binding protein n=1 Tax=Sphingopyxis sp. R3-92 TaxID=3158553 RepID=UPI003EE7B4C5